MRMGVAFAAAVMSLLPSGAALAAAAPGGFAFEHTLSDFSGPIPFMGVRVRLDQVNDEVYILSGKSVRIFGPSGMEVFSFVLDTARGAFADIAVDELGDIYVLGYKPDGALEGRGFFLLRCDYRGEPQAEIFPTGLSEELASLGPDSMVYSNGRFYLASSSKLTVAAVDRKGALRQVFNLADLAGLDKPTRADAVMAGFDVAPDGRMAFSIPTDFTVRIVTADGAINKQVGEAGSKPGQFGNVGAVRFDADGNLCVADRLRSVVQIFDRGLRFVTEIGGYGESDGKLIMPADVAVSATGKLYVSQMKRRGVSVFISASRGGRG